MRLERERVRVLEGEAVQEMNEGNRGAVEGREKGAEEWTDERGKCCCYTAEQVFIGYCGVRSCFFVSGI